MSALDPFDPLRYGFDDGDAAYAFAHWMHDLPPGWERLSLHGTDDVRRLLARALDQPVHARAALDAWHRFVDEELWNLTLRPPGTLSDDDLVHFLTHHLADGLGWTIAERLPDGFGGMAGASPALAAADALAGAAVAAEPEPAWLSVAYRYADGTPVAEAPFEVRFADGATQRGTLDGEGQARLDGLPPARAGQAVEVTFGESPHAWVLKPEYAPANAPNPHYRQGSLDATLMGSVGLLASADAGGLPLDRPASHFDTAPAADGAGVLDWIWGVVLGEFEEDPTTGQVVAGALLTMIPGIDQVADVRDLGAYLYKFSADEASRTDGWVWAGFVATGVGVVPVVGSPVKGVLKLLIRGAREGSAVTRSAVLDVVRYFGRGDAEAFVQRHLDAATLERQALEAFAEVAEKARRIFAWVADHTWASAEAKAAARAGLRSLAEVERVAPRMIARAVRRLRERLERALKGDGDEAASGSVNAHVEARAPERAPPDLEGPPEPPRGPRPAVDAEALARLEALLGPGSRAHLEAWASEGLSPSRLEAALRRSVDPAAVFEELKGSKSVFHRRVLINDGVGSIPGVRRGAYVGDGLPREVVRAPRELLREFDLPAREAENFSSVRFMELAEGEKLYRVRGPGSYDTGGYWTRTRPRRYEDVIGGLAVMPEWNGCTEVIEYTVPPGGIKAWVGETAAKPVTGKDNPFFEKYREAYHLPGGDEQVYMPLPYRDYMDEDAMEAFKASITKREAFP